MDLKFLSWVKMFAIFTLMEKIKNLLSVNETESTKSSTKSSIVLIKEKILFRHKTEVTKMG